MTIEYFNRFWQARPAGFDGVFEWDFLKGCFPRGIMPMDFDAVVEINGQFLVFETKAPSRTVDTGQRLTFQALLKIPNFTVFMLYGKTVPTITRLIVCRGDDRKNIYPATEAIVREEAKRWVQYAEGYRSGDSSSNTVKKALSLLRGVRELRCENCGSDDVIAMDSLYDLYCCQNCGHERSY